MKKSLQYVLMMSALGLQSGVLLAQPGLVAQPLEVVGQKMDTGITMADLQSMLDSAKSKWRGKGFNDNLYQTLQTDIKNQPPLQEFIPNQLMGYAYQDKAFILNALMKNLKGVKFINSLSEDARKKIVKEFVDQGVFETFNGIAEIQAPIAIAAYANLGINSPQLNLTEESKRRIRAALNTSSGKRKSTKSNLTLSQFVGGAFLTDTFGFRDTMNRLLQKNALTTEADFDLDYILADSRLPKKSTAYLLASILSTPSGRAVYANVPSPLKKEIAKLAEDIKTNNPDDGAILFYFRLGLLRTAKEYPHKKIIAEKDQKSLFLKMAAVAKSNPTISLEKKIELLQVVKKSKLSAEELDAYAECKADVLKVAPKEKLTKVKRLLNDEKSKNDDVDIDSWSLSVKQKDQKSDDAKKVVPEVKDTQKLINNSEQKGASDRSETYDKEQKKMDKSKK